MYSFVHLGLGCLFTFARHTFLRSFLQKECWMHAVMDQHTCTGGWVMWPTAFMDLLMLILILNGHIKYSEWMSKWMIVQMFRWRGGSAKPEPSLIHGLFIVGREDFSSVSCSRGWRGRWPTQRTFGCRTPGCEHRATSVSESCNGRATKGHEAKHGSCGRIQEEGRWLGLQV